MHIEHWVLVKNSFSILCYAGIVTNIVNLSLRTFVEHKAIGPWVGGTLITGIVGAILFGLPFGVFGLLATEITKQQTYYQLALWVGFLLPLWLDPILTAKRLVVKKSYHQSTNMGAVFLLLLVLAAIFLILLFLTK